MSILTVELSKQEMKKADKHRELVREKLEKLYERRVLKFEKKWLKFIEEMDFNPESWVGRKKQRCEEEGKEEEGEEG
jgi:hypothetical protein